MPSNSLRRRSLSKAAKHHELAGSHELSPDDNQITRPWVPRCFEAAIVTSGSYLTRSHRHNVANSRNGDAELLAPCLNEVPQKPPCPRTGAGRLMRKAPSLYEADRLTPRRPPCHGLW